MRLPRPSWKACSKPCRDWRKIRTSGSSFSPARGGAFCSGGDVKSMAEGSASQNFEDAVQRLRGRMEVARLLHEIEKPTIAMVNGVAAGAGLSLALACDLRIAARRARFVTAFAKVGFSGDFANRLIESDPYGVLTYGDAASLSPGSRHLLEALARLSEKDPWFRSGRWELPALGMLARPDMIQSFRAILNSSTANFGLRSVVVDALAAGPPMPAMLPDLVAVLASEQLPFAQRAGAMTALERLGQSGTNALVAFCKCNPPLTGSALHLHTLIIAHRFLADFTAGDVFVEEVTRSCSSATRKEAHRRSRRPCSNRSPRGSTGSVKRAKSRRSARFWGAISLMRCSLL